MLGITKYKLIVVMKPNDGGIPSVSFTFVCLYTTLAGMSANGITGMTIIFVYMNIFISDSSS